MSINSNVINTKQVKEKILQITNLHTQLQVGDHFYVIIDNLNLSLEKGKTIAIVGESGCGKTMTALSILRLLPPAALHPTGEVLFADLNLLTVPEPTLQTIRGSRIAMIFQDPSSALNPVYTIGDQLMEAVTIHFDISKEQAKQKALTALTEVGIPCPQERFDEYPHQLSGGLKQRVMIAMALISQPDILIADEPTTALDVTIQAQVLELIRSLQKKKNMSLLLITHDIGVVAEMADDVIVMYASQVVESGSVEDIFYHRAHPYTKGLFDSSSSLRSPGGNLRTIKGFVPSLNNIPQGCRFHPRCPYVMEKCKKSPVPEFPIMGIPTHLSRCWLHDGSEESNVKRKNMEMSYAAPPA